MYLVWVGSCERACYPVYTEMYAGSFALTATRYGVRRAANALRMNHTGIFSVFRASVARFTHRPGRRR